jgi:hypothetical protein
MTRCLLMREHASHGHGGFTSFGLRPLHAWGWFVAPVYPLFLLGLGLDLLRMNDERFARGVAGERKPGELVQTRFP